ncbi:MFS transporter [Haloechinothrix halophila]|uniref:MFS transporter n=1 Tax=Haloechinothrix halophila TaxID=1069073 RepID=UPI0003F76862|nr:MFS transporter [Haloechinothrix halophila]
MQSDRVGPVPAADPRARKREQRGWYFYDWAAQPMFTSVTTTFGALFLNALATEDAKQNTARNGPNPCVTPDGAESSLHSCDVSLLGWTMSAGVVWNYLVAAALIAQIVVLPITGAINDRSHNRKGILGTLAFTGATAIGLMVFAAGDNWQLAALLYLIGQVAAGASIIVYYSFLIDIADPDERDAVSSRGWSLGYLGGALALAIQLVLVFAHDSVGITQGEAVRIAFLLSGLWWAGFTLIPLRRIVQRSDPPPITEERSVLLAGFTELGDTIRGTRAVPLTLLFLGAYLVYNDGVATVINVSAQYGDQELGFGPQVLTVTILVVQLIAFVGAWALGRVAVRVGAKRTILGCLVLWIGVLIAAYHLQPGDKLMFWAVAAGIGFVLGGTQALSRSLYSQLIPSGKEGQYFSLYEMTERGTSWMGPLLFGVIADATGSFRPAIIALTVFFVVGFCLLALVPVRRAIVAAGNQPPTRI